MGDYKLHETEEITSNIKEKKRTKLKIIIYGLMTFVIIWLFIYLMPFKTQEGHPMFKKDRPLVMAHQGGQHLAPPSTMEAFLNAKDLGVDIIEFDIHMSKDGYLIPIHDPTIDRTTDGTGTVNDMTLNELQAVDAGAKFKDLNGDYSFKGKGITLPTVEEMFEQIPNMRWNIEIKDTNDPALYRPIMERLWDLLVEFEIEDKALLASFDQDIIDIILDVSDGKAVVAAGRKEVTKFVIFHKLFLNGLYRPSVQALEIPTDEGFINLKDKKLIKGAHKLGMDVHYWTINDREVMEELLDLGADGIITDRPDILIDLIEEKYRE